MDNLIIELVLTMINKLLNFLLKILLPYSPQEYANRNSTHQLIPLIPTLQPSLQETILIACTLRRQIISNDFFKSMIRLIEKT